MLHNFRPQLEKALKNENDPKSIYLLKEIIAENEQNDGKEDIETGNDYLYLADHYSEQERYEDALVFYTQIELIWARGVHLFHPDTAKLYNTIGSTYNFMQNFDPAIEYLKKAIALYDILYEKDNWLSADSYTLLACVYTNLGDFKTALKLQLAVLPILIAYHGKLSTQVIGAYYSIANAYYGRKNYPRALLYFRKTLIIVNRILPEGEDEIKHFAQSYAAALIESENNIPETLYDKHLAYIQKHFIRFFE